MLLNPAQLIDRLAALIPPPRTHQLHYHGVLTANSPLRRAVTYFAGKPIPRLHSPWDDLIAYLENSGPSALILASPNYAWADLIRRVYEDDPLECPNCGSSMRIIAFVTEPGAIYRILIHVGLPAEAPAPEEAQDTPQLEFWERGEWQVYRGEIDLTVTIDAYSDPVILAEMFPESRSQHGNPQGTPAPFQEYLDPPHPEEYIDPPHPEEVPYIYAY